MTGLIFDRPNKAFSDYEQSLAAKPRSWPPTHHPVPTLWDRVRTLFAVVIAAIGSVRDLATRDALARKERRDLLARLKPVEAIVRVLLVTEAITWLLMTPAGRALMRAAKPCAIPAPPTPPTPPPKLSPARAAFASAMRAAMQTIADLRPREDPRIAEREAQQRRDAFLAGEIPSAAEPRGRFSVLRWSHDPPPVDDTPPSAPHRGHGLVIDLWDDDRPFAANAAAARDGEDDAAPAAALARRIAALQHIIENPEPAIRRLAARIASLPRDVLAAPYERHRAASLWWHGRPEYFNAVALARTAHHAYTRTLLADPRPHDPG